MLQEAGVRSRLEKEFAGAKVEFVGGKKEGTVGVEVRQEPGWLRLYAEQMLLLYSRQTKGSDANRSAMRADLMSVVKVVGPEHGADLLKAAELWHEKNLGEVVKQIEALKLRLPLTAYLGVFQVGACVDRLFQKDRKEMQTRTVEAFIKVLGEAARR